MEQNNSTSPAPSEVVSNEEAPATTLEDIAKSLSVEEQANQFVSSVPQPPQPQYQPNQNQNHYTPDPVMDPEGYRNYVAAQTQAFHQLQQTLQSVAQKQESWEQREQKQKIDKDVDYAVSKVNEKLKVDPALAEIALEREYRTNPTFKKIWDNRDRNPDAYNKALDVMAGKLAPMFAVRQDPKIAENVRAAQSAQRSMSTTTQQTKQDGWNSLPQGEFEQKWAQLIRGNY